MKWTKAEIYNDEAVATKDIEIAGRKITIEGSVMESRPDRWLGRVVMTAYTPDEQYSSSAIVLWGRKAFPSKAEAVEWATTIVKG